MSRRTLSRTCCHIHGNAGQVRAGTGSSHIIHQSARIVWVTAATAVQGWGVGAMRGPKGETLQQLRYQHIEDSVV